MAVATLRRSPRVATATVSVVVPLCDEEANLTELYRRLAAVFDALSFDGEFVFVDDGSTDSTPRMLAHLAERDPRVTAIHFSRNFGHQAAVTAGLEHTTGDAVIVMDGDLQDPPELLPRLIDRWREGCDVVYAVRRRRKENVVKRLGYFAFYRLLRRASDLDLPLDAGDFCLLDRQAVDALNNLPERTRFVRGLRSYVGFRQSGIEYERSRREHGSPKYTLRKLAALAFDGLYDFSSFPQRLLSGAGAIAIVISICLAIAAIVGASTSLGLFATILCVGGAQFIALAMLGEYLRRILLEVKGRPPYIIREIHRKQAA
jgi:dolichol-phosphate mannosyltransferase